MKQKNPIRNEIVYLWQKEKIPKNLLRQEKVTSSDEESHKMSGGKWEKIFGKKEKKK